jgi:hypothetical protein
VDKKVHGWAGLMTGWMNRHTYGWIVQGRLTPLFHSSLLRTAFVLLLLVSATWLLGLLAVNSDTLSFHYLFAAFSCLQVGVGQGHPVGPLLEPTPKDQQCHCPQVAMMHKS